MDWPTVLEEAFHRQKTSTKKRELSLQVDPLFIEVLKENFESTVLRRISQGLKCHQVVFATFLMPLLGLFLEPGHSQPWHKDIKQHDGRFARASYRMSSSFMSSTVHMCYLTICSKHHLTLLCFCLMLHGMLLSKDCVW